MAICQPGSQLGFVNGHGGEGLRTDVLCMLPNKDAILTACWRSAGYVDGESPLLNLMRFLSRFAALASELSCRSMSSNCKSASSSSGTHEKGFWKRLNAFSWSLKSEKRWSDSSQSFLWGHGSFLNTGDVKLGSHLCLCHLRAIYRQEMSEISLSELSLQQFKFSLESFDVVK